MTIGTLLIVVVVSLLVVLVLAWLAATRVKQRLDRVAPDAKQERRTIYVSPACVGRLRELTADPLLLELGDGVLRYQAGQQPMTQASLAPGEAGKALRETGSALVTELGPNWTVIVRPLTDESLAVDRLR